MSMPEWAKQSESAIVGEALCKKILKVGVGSHHKLAVQLGVASLLYIHRLADELGVSVTDLTPDHVVDSIVTHHEKWKSS